MKNLIIILVVIGITSCNVQNKIDRKENIKSVVRTVGAVGTVVIIHKSVTKISDDCKSCK